MAMGRLNHSGLLFLPKNWQRAAVLRWLKRTHAWTGFWGAILFLMLGVSGFLLNHRSIWKIETGEPVEVQAMTIAVDPALIKDEGALGLWAKDALGLPTVAKPPRKKDAEAKVFLGKTQIEPVKWAQQFTHPDGQVIVEYSPGANSVAVRQDARNLLGTIKYLHMSTGVGLAWVLFMDSIAGALITMTLTGFLLWTRLHGSRLVGGGIVMASLLAATVTIWSYLL